MKPYDFNKEDSFDQSSYHQNRIYMTVSKKKLKKQKNTLPENEKDSCIPGSAVENCQDEKPSQRHLKTFHGDYFFYKGIKSIIIRLI